MCETIKYNLFNVSTPNTHFLRFERDCWVLNKRTQGSLLAPQINPKDYQVLNRGEQSATRLPTASTPLAPQVNLYFLNLIWNLVLSALSLVLLYTIGAFFTLDAYKIIWIQYLTFNFDTLTWSTQLTKSSMVPKAVTQKTTWSIVVPNMPKTNTAVSVLTVTPILLKSYYYRSDFGSPRALQCSRGYE